MVAMALPWIPGTPAEAPSGTVDPQRPLLIPAQSLTLFTVFSQRREMACMGDRVLGCQETWVSSSSPAAALCVRPRECPTPLGLSSLICKVQGRLHDHYGLGDCEKPVVTHLISTMTKGELSSGAPLVYSP